MSDRPVALITGAAGGMASALATGFRTAGYDVVAVDRAASDGVEALDVTDGAAVIAFARALPDAERARQCRRRAHAPRRI